MMIVYLTNLKYKGNPKPKYSNYFEFWQNDIGYLSIALKQHGHLNTSCILFRFFPGFVDLAWA